MLWVLGVDWKKLDRRLETWECWGLGSSGTGRLTPHDRFFRTLSSLICSDLAAPGSVLSPAGR